LESLFNKLAEQWREDTKTASSITDIALNPAYQRIIGMGPVAIPFILRRLQKEPEHWFWALRSITGADPVQPEQRGKIRLMSEAWCNWARQAGVIW
jgi:hypothetical protein